METVIRVFEDVSRGVLSAVQVDDLWKSIGKDPDQSIQQLVDCLTHCALAPEGASYVKYFVAFIQAWVSRLRLACETARNADEKAVGAVLVLLSRRTCLAPKWSRERILRFLHDIIRHLPSPARLHQAQLSVVAATLRIHLNDKEDVVRELAVKGLAMTLTALEELPVAEHEDGQALLSLLQCETTERVRIALVSSIPLDASTLASVLEHTRDRSAKVAAAVYDRMTRDMKFLGLEGSPPGDRDWQQQRLQLLQCGLQDIRKDVCKAAHSLLRDWFKGGAHEDVLHFIEVLDPVRNPDACYLCLMKLAAAPEHDEAAWDPVAWLKAEACSGGSLKALAARAVAEQGMQGGDSGQPAAASLTPAQAYTWAFACRHLSEGADERRIAAARAVGAEAARAHASNALKSNDVLEEFLPSEQELVALSLQGLQAGLHYVAGRLVEIASLGCMSWADASNREAAEQLLTRILQSEHPSSPDRGSTYGSPGSWEAGAMQLAVSVSGGGGDLVQLVLPEVLRLTEAAGSSETMPQQRGAESLLQQSLSYLQHLLALAGPRTPATAVATLADGSSCTLAEAVERLAVATSTHDTAFVRCAAAQCCVQLCLRDGGQAYLRSAVTMLGNMHSEARAAAQGRGKDTAAQQALWRVAQRGLMDLALTYGMPMVDSELLEAARRRQVEAVAARLARAGLGTQSGGEEPGAATEAGQDACGLGMHETSVVGILLRQTEGVVKRLQGSDSYAAARGAPADALVGMARLLLAHATMLQLRDRLGGAVASMQDKHTEELLLRLLLARYSPALAEEPSLTRQLDSFFQEMFVAKTADDTSDAQRAAAAQRKVAAQRLLAPVFLRAGRCAISLPPPDGSPVTAKCAAPALMDFMAQMMAPIEDYRVPRDQDDDDDEVATAARPGGQDSAAEAAEPSAWLCAHALEEVVRVVSPGHGSLLVTDPRVKAYLAQLCKVPACLGVVSARHARRLLFLGMRAEAAARQHADKLVPNASLEKLQEFVAAMEALLKENTAPLTEEEAAPIIEALLSRLASLPGQEQLQEEVEADEAWDAVAELPRPTGRKRVTAVRRKPSSSSATSTGAASSRGTRQTSQPTKPSASRKGATSGRTARGPAAAAGLDSDENDDDDFVDDGRQQRDRAAGRQRSSQADAGSCDDGAAGRRSSSAAADSGAARPASSTVSSASVAASEGGARRSSRAAAAKASQRMAGMREREAALSRAVQDAGGDSDE